MNAGKWFQIIRWDISPDEPPYQWTEKTRLMWRSQIKPILGRGIRKYFKCSARDLREIDPLPSIFVAFPADVPMSGHLASIRMVWENLKLQNYECCRNDISIRTPRKYFGVGMMTIWSKYVLRRLAEISPVFQPIWEDLKDIPSGECGIYLAEAPDPAWLESISANEPRLFDAFREARQLAMVGLDLSEPRGEVKRHHDLAKDLLTAGKYEEGEALLEEMLVRWPDFWRAYWDLTMSAMANDNHRKAYAAVRRAQIQFPHSLNFDRLGADCAIQFKDWRRAEWHLKRLWGLNPWDPNLMIRYAWVAYEQQSYGLAAKLYEECAEHLPLSWPARFKYGMALSKINRIGDALALFKEMERDDPGNALLLNNIGMLLAGTGRPLEGLNYCWRALEANPDMDCIWDTLGFAHMKTHNYREAAQALLKAVDLNPNFPDAWRHLLHVYHKADDPERLAGAKAYVGQVMPDQLARFETEIGMDLVD